MIILDMDMPKNCSECFCNPKCKNYYYMKDGRSRLCPIKCDVDDIKAEINEQIKIDPYRLYAAIEIIDRHISGKDGEQT